MSITAECTNCRATTRSPLDMARAGGWRIWDGVSVTDKPLNVRLCPVCVGGRDGEEPPQPPTWRVGCHTCHWEWEDEDGTEEPLTEKDARSMAADHECEKHTYVLPPKTAEELASDEARRARSRVALVVAT